MRPEDSRGGCRKTDEPGMLKRPERDGCNQVNLEEAVETEEAGEGQRSQDKAVRY